MARRRCWMTETVIGSTAKIRSSKEDSPRRTRRTRRGRDCRREAPERNLRVLRALRGSTSFSLHALGGEVFHRRRDAALAVRDAGELERHFFGGEGAEEHRLVEIAHVADAEGAPVELVEPAADRDVEAVEGDAARLFGIVSLRH